MAMNSDPRLDLASFASQQAASSPFVPVTAGISTGRPGRSGRPSGGHHLEESKMSTREHAREHEAGLRRESRLHTQDRLEAELYDVCLKYVPHLSDHEIGDALESVALNSFPNEDK